MRKSNRTIVTIVAVAALGSAMLTACASGEKGAETTAQEMTTETAAEISTESVTETAAEAATETAAEATETSGQETAALANPVQKVDSSEDFKTIGFNLQLPEDSALYRDPVYSIISGELAQIQFHDETTGSDAMVRAGKEGKGDQSGVYYVFDEKKENYSVTLPDGNVIEITVSVTEQNSDIHGALASWVYGGTAYTLWEDSARDHAEDFAKMAVEIAKQSV